MVLQATFWYETLRAVGIKKQLRILPHHIYTFLMGWQAAGWAAGVLAYA